MSNRRYKPKPNYFWSILSVSVVLTFVGIFFFFTLHSYDVIDQVKGSFEIVAELQPGIKEQQQKELIHFFQGDTAVAAESVTFVSREEALQTLAGEMGADLEVAGIANPLFDAIIFKLKPAFSSQAQVQSLEGRLAEREVLISGMHFQGGLMDKIIANLERLKLIFLVAGIILVLLAMTLIFNSIRMSLYANRFLIKNMELVGASWGFIRAPFLKTSVWHGLLSALLTLIVMLGIFAGLQQYVPEISAYINLTYILYIIGVIVVGGILLNLVSTYHVVTKYLRLRTRDLYR